MRIAPLLLASCAIGLASIVGYAQTPPPATDSVNPWQTADSDAPAAAPAARAVDGEAVNPWQSDTATVVPDGRTTKTIRPRAAGRKVLVPRTAAERKGIAPYVPGKGARKTVRNPDDPIAWFPGFIRLENGSTRVFLEISKRVEISEHRAEGRLTYRLKGASVPERVNRMPLVTAFFATPIERVTLVPEGGDADLVIELRRPSESAFRVLDTPRGIVLQVDFPATADGRTVLPPPAAQLGTTSSQLPGSSTY